MATTTATVNISSTDLQPGNALGISASTTLYQTGTTTGLDLVDYGVGSLTEASAGDALQESLVTADTSNYVYICNTSTDKDQYMVIGIHDTVIGNLGSEEWLFMPWNMSDGDAEINIEAETSGSVTYEYAIFKSTYTLPAKT